MGTESALSPLEDVLREALTALDHRDRDALARSLDGFAQYGPTGLVLLRYAAAWSLSETSARKYADADERARAVSAICSEDGPLSAALERDQVEALVDVLSRQPANGRKLSDDMLYLAFLSVVYFGIAQHWAPEASWQPRYERMFADFVTYCVR